ncbi:unnamed protein product, partial [Menidia menidia]
ANGGLRSDRACGLQANGGLWSSGLLLPYPAQNLVLDVVLLLLLLALETLRLFYGWKGNLTEGLLASGLALLVLVPGGVLVVYLLVLQTFVLRLELVLAAGLLVFQGLELLLGLLCLSSFSRAKVY